jgi:hypothetical protein
MNPGGRAGWAKPATAARLDWCGNRTPEQFQRSINAIRSALERCADKEAMAY